MTRIVSGTVDVVNGDATFTFHGASLTDANCPADAQIVIDGALYYVASRTNTTTGELTRAYAGSTGDGKVCEIDPLTPTTSTIANFARQVSEYNARLEFLDAYGKGLFYTLLGMTGAADPGPGKIGRNAAAWVDVTELYLDVLDAGGFAATPLIDAWAASTIITVRSLATRAFASYSLSTAPSDQSSAWRLLENLTYLGGDGILADGEDVAIEWNRVGNFEVTSNATVANEAGLAAFVHQVDGFKVLVVDIGDGRSGVYTLDQSGSPASWIGPAILTGPQGPAGDTGPTGSAGPTGADGTDPGVLATWNEGNSDTDPGAGKIAADADDLSAAAVLYISKTNRAGDDISTWLATLDDSTSTTKGRLILTRSGGNAQVAWKVTGLTDATGYVKVAVSSHSGATGFVDGNAISIQFSPTGDAGSGAVTSVNGLDGTVVLSTDEISDVGKTNKWATAAEKTAVGYLTVTSATDLDAIRARVTELDAAVILKGGWDASSGSFPGSGAAQAGWSYVVTTGGTVDGVAFTTNDRLLAIVDNASTGTYAANWLKLDYTDVVTSVAGRTGAVTLAQADISGLTTADSPRFASVEIGAASDTTLSRSAAGRLAVEGNPLLNAKPRVVATASSTTPTPDADATDLFDLYALAAAAAFGAPTGTPANGQKLLIRIKDNGTARALTWNAIYRSCGATLPTTTVLGKTMYVGLIYNATDSKWDCVAVSTEA